MNTQSLQVLIPFAAVTQLFGFEVQRWARARANGKRGSNEAFGLFVDLTSKLTTLIFYAWFIFVCFRVGIAEAVTIFISSIVIVSLSGLITGPDRLWKWLLGLVGIWPLTIALFFLV